MKKKKRKKNKINEVAILLTLFLILGIGIWYLFFFRYKYTFKLKDNVTISVNTRFNPEEYIETIKNASVKYTSISTSSIGEEKVRYIVTDKRGKKHNYVLNVKIIDDVAPSIEGKDHVIVYKGDAVDLKKYIKITDNYDKEFNIKTDHKIDTSKIGDQEIVYSVADNSGNITKFTITFTIKDRNNSGDISISDGIIGTTSKGYTIENRNGATYINNVLIANKSYPLSSSYGNGLSKETTSAFQDMKTAAALAGIDLYIGSGYRSYNSQKSIYSNYVKRDGQEKADTYSARAGHSEHQSGLGIDICSHDEKACITSGFNNTASAKWLHDNAQFYGFILRYPDGKTDETGYKYESWHYRYVGKELAEKLYNDGNWITLEDYFGISSKYAE